MYSFNILKPTNCTLLSIERLIFSPGVGFLTKLNNSIDLPRLSLRIFLIPLIDPSSIFLEYSIPD